MRNIDYKWNERGFGVNPLLPRLFVPADNPLQSSSCHPRFFIGGLSVISNLTFLREASVYRAHPRKMNLLDSYTYKRNDLNLNGIRYRRKPSFEL